MKKTLNIIFILLLLLVVQVSFQVYAQDDIVIDTLKNGEVEDVENIVWFSSQLNKKIGEYEANYLFYAAFNDDVKVMQYLIDKGGDVNFKSKHGETPLMIAAVVNDNIDVIKLLINSGANINQRNNGGYTPVLYSAMNSNLDVIKLLVTNGGDLYVKDSFERSALHIAAENNDNPLMIRFLKNKGLDLYQKDFHDEIPFIKALRYNNTDIFYEFVLIDKNLFYYKGDMGENILHYASYNNNPGILHALLEPEKKLFEVSSRDEFGRTCLFPAVLYNENIEVMKYLIIKGVNINSRTLDGKTVLINLVTSPTVSYIDDDKLERIKLLVENGADINIKDKYGDGLLSNALSSNENIEVINYFFSKKNYSIAELNDLFFDAVINENINVVQFFLDKIKNINNRNVLGATPLMYAARFNNNPKVIELLLNNGANPKLIDNEGNTAYDHMKDNYFLDGSNIHWKLHDLKF